MKQKAFTLIELLVVIAIIAILAAILFPVFAQAKQAAKKAASISNNKQIALAGLMYSNDYDDGLPLMFNDVYANVVDGKHPNSDTWVLSTQPYVKNLQLMVDPLQNDKDNIFGSGPFAWFYNQNLFPFFGYNYVFLSPWHTASGGCTDGDAQSRTSSGANKPANTVMFTESNDFGTAGVGYFTSTAPGMYPPLLQAAHYCVWTGAGWSQHPTGNPNVPTTAEIYIKAQSTSTTTFLDGHAKGMKDTALAIGTDYSTQSDPLQTKIIDTSVYMWGYNDEYTFAGG